MTHIPVLLKETLFYLNVEHGQKFIDATAGEGGHTRALLATNPDAKVLAIDLDQSALDKINDPRSIVVAGNYKDLKQIASRVGFLEVSGVLLDLGFSSFQLDDPSRGFSFQKEGPLDMRYDKTQKLTAEYVVNHYPPPQLEKIFREFGEERLGRKIASAIASLRKQSRITSTRQLFNIIKVPDRARRIFQAVRIEVNHELGNLVSGLAQTPEILKSGGRLVVISFHSLEDRIVKQFLKQSKELKIITKKPIRATEAEQAVNPRSKSAKLRAAEKI